MEETQGTGSGMEGQPGEGTAAATPTTPTGTDPAQGQPEGTTAGTTGQVAGTQQSAEETFFDPRDIADKPELLAAYKQMQKAFGKKNEEIKAAKQKIEVYDQFSQDPLNALKRMASQMGLELTRPGGQPTPPGQPGEAEPQSWEDVFRIAEQRAEAKLMQRFAPVLQEVSTLKRSNIEKLLDDSAPDWRQYEDDMMSNLRAHPSLVNDPVKLYRLSVPPEVLESRATQAALKKMQDKVNSAQTSGQSTTNKKAGVGSPDKAMSFQEAVNFAKAQLAEQGMRPPH
jgi:hypothetical protein